MAKIIIHHKAHEVREGETLLEALERLGYEVEYQCRQGYCGSCRMRVEGQFIYRHTPLAFAQRGEVFACCAIPKSNIVLDARFVNALIAG